MVQVMMGLVKDIENMLTRYSTLKRVPGKFIVFEGVFTAHSEDGATSIDDYNVRITLMSNYPHSFPKVEEIGNKILPRNATRHINIDGTLCLANPVDEARVCRNGITLIWFLEYILNPHLCREYVCDRKGSYITGERSHGMEGVWESYYDIFGTDDKEFIINEIELVLSHHSIERNDPCYCNSGKKYKICHTRVASKILDIGRKRLEEIFNHLKGAHK